MMHRLLRLSRAGLSCLDAPTVNQVVRQPTNLVFVRNASSKGFVMGRQIRTLNKLLTGKKKSKKNWKIDDDVPKLPSIESLSNPTSHGKSSQRRVHVLNKLFMRHITDYMATDSTFTGYALEISRVNITTDFKLVNVYWLARGDGTDERLEAMLSKSTGMLRYNLSTLRLMGEVPMIKFVKDRFYAKSVEVDMLLKVADFGDDYVPSTPSQMIRNDLSGNTIPFDNELPEMTHTILGLNHAEIMNRIKHNMSKAKQAWEKYETVLPTSLQEKYAPAGEERRDTIVRLREEEFQAFLSQRRTRNRKERRPRPATENDDFDEDDAADLSEEQDTYDDDFEIEKK
ncbi:uncharacterized protein LOC119073667 [Bradysia coprophila]|uniref:uncharacterized protein LOC119073667 n=1 Tax=Bradysia coprophila TaxID=38358 RepID=UPI00187DA73A|nr:uncharacterized protein LOC119073667 [Bradysia coprophila]